MSELSSGQVIEDSKNTKKNKREFIIHLKDSKHVSFYVFMPFISSEICCISCQTRTLATNNAVTVAKVRLSPEVAGRPGAALHRSESQHVLVIL